MNFTGAQSPNMASPWNTRVAQEDGRSNAEMLAAAPVGSSCTWVVVGGRLCWLVRPVLCVVSASFTAQIAILAAL